MLDKTITRLNFKDFSSTRVNVAKLKCEHDGIRLLITVAIDEVCQEELRKPTSEVPVTERHDAFQDMRRLALKVSD